MLKPTAVRRDLRLQPVRPASWWFDALLLVGFGAVTLALATGALLGLDLAVREWAYAHHPAPIYWTARAFNLIGQGGWLLTPLAGALAVAVAWRGRTVRPLLLVAGAFVLLYLTVGPLKLLTDRAAPSSDLPPTQSVRIFNDLPPTEYDLSYPSGHVVNAILWYGVIAVLLTALTAGRLHPTVHRLIRFAPPAILLVTTTYLNFHWLTDGVSALLIGLFLDRLLHRVPWDGLPLPGQLRAWDRPFTSYP